MANTQSSNSPDAAKLVSYQRWRDVAIEVDRTLNIDPLSPLITIDLVQEAMNGMMRDIRLEDWKTLYLLGPVNRAINFIASLRYNPNLFAGIKTEDFVAIGEAAKIAVRAGDYMAPYVALIASVNEAAHKSIEPDFLYFGGSPQRMPADFVPDCSHAQRLYAAYEEHEELPRVSFVEPDATIIGHLDLSDLANSVMPRSLAQVGNEVWIIPVRPFAPYREVAKKIPTRMRQILRLEAEEIVSFYSRNRRIFNRIRDPGRIAWAQADMRIADQAFENILSRTINPPIGEWRAMLENMHMKIDSLSRRGQPLAPR